MKSRKYNQDRRNFLRSAGFLIAAAVVPATVAGSIRPTENVTGRVLQITKEHELIDQSLIKKLEVNNLIQKQREGVISRTLSTVEGRKALSASMVEPIQRSLNYKSFLRRAFKNKNIFYTEGKYIPEKLRHCNAFSSDICLSEIKSRRFYLIDKAQIDMHQKLLNDEFDCLNQVLESSKPYYERDYSKYFEKARSWKTKDTWNVSEGERLLNFIINDMDNIHSLKNSREKIPGCKTETILMHPKQYSLIKEPMLMNERCSLANAKDVLLCGIFGQIDSANVLVSSKMKEGVIYLLPSEEFAGDFYFEDLVVESNDSPSRITIGWKAVNKFNVVIKDDAVSKIIV